MVTKSPIVRLRSETDRLKMVPPDGGAGSLTTMSLPPTVTTVSIASGVVLTWSSTEPEADTPLPPNEAEPERNPATPPPRRISAPVPL